MGERIRAARVYASLSQVELAEILGVHQSTLWRWEAGRTVPDSSQLLALSKALGRSVGWILTGER